MSADGPRSPSIRLVLMSRAPVPGKTKTRLTPPLSPEQARDFHVACLQDVLEAALAWRDQREAAGLTTQVYLFITPGRSQALFREAGVRWPEHVTVRPQVGRTLGQRMENALASVLKNAEPPAWALLVGTDLPLLDKTHFDEALAALRRAEVVFGPTIDGGFYLVGVKVSPAGLFQGTRWGTRTALKDTLRAVHAKGRQTALISPLLDADTVDDLRSIRSHSRHRRVAHSRSLRFIETYFQGGQLGGK